MSGVSLSPRDYVIYVVPGTILLCAIAMLSGNSDLMGSLDAGRIAVFILIGGYALGHISASISNPILKLAWRIPCLSDPLVENADSFITKNADKYLSKTFRAFFEEKFADQNYESKEFYQIMWLANGYVELRAPDLEISIDRSIALENFQKTLFVSILALSLAFSYRFEPYFLVLSVTASIVVFLRINHLRRWFGMSIVRAFVVTCVVNQRDTLATDIAS